MERDWATFLHMGISFPRIGCLVLAPPDMAINLFIGKSIHCFRMSWSGALLTSLWKGPQKLWPGAEDSVAGDIWRGAGVRVGDRFLLSIPADSGMQGSWR